MKRVITYGTFDLLHNGHINILKRAKEYGDYLVVGVTSENYDMSRGKLNVKESLTRRIQNVKNTGLADKIIVEETFGQKVNDIQKHKIDTFVIGSDWMNKFDYLKEYCEVVYLPRTPGVSSTELRNEKNGILRVGIVGYGRIANRFIEEAKYVSGINIESVFGRSINKAKDFASKYEINSYHDNYDEFLKDVDVLYIATPHTTHFEYAKKAILQGKHVLCEKPMCLDTTQAKELFDLAKENNVIFYEAVKTAYSPCFTQLYGVAKSGLIGNIKNVSATFTKLVSDKTLREYNPALGGGALNELGTYVLFGIIKLLGTDYKKVNFSTMLDTETGVDVYTKVNISYKNAMATGTVGLGVKQEGDMIISGTKGYIYVPAPWWKTEYFEVRFEDTSKTLKYFYKFEGDGLRYEIADFISAVNSGKKSYKLRNKESLAMVKILDTFKQRLSTKENIEICTY